VALSPHSRSIAISVTLAYQDGVEVDDFVRKENCSFGYRTCRHPPSALRAALVSRALAPWPLISGCRLSLHGTSDAPMSSQPSRPLPWTIATCSEPSFLSVYMQYSHPLLSVHSSRVRTDDHSPAHCHLPPSSTMPPPLHSCLRQYCHLSVGTGAV